MEARRFVCGLNGTFYHPVWEQIQDLFLLAVSSCCEYISIILKASVELQC